MSVCSLIIPIGMYTIVLELQQKKQKKKGRKIDDNFSVKFPIFLTVFTSNVLLYNPCHV